ncbi:MAG TPA: hypothetical protein VLL97_01405, partial [Acidobacteriota bacterium]|nr:hypothetical protein [Acidobacteriota bacterium]
MDFIEEMSFFARAYQGKAMMTAGLSRVSSSRQGDFLMRLLGRGCTAAVLVVFLALVSAAHAQETEQGIYTDRPIGREGDQGIYTIPTPVERQEIVIDDTRSRAIRSFANTVAWNPVNRFGFSLGIDGGTISNVNPVFMEKRRSTLTAMSGGVFAN